MSPILYTRDLPVGHFHIFNEKPENTNLFALKQTHSSMVHHIQNIQNFETVGDGLVADLNEIRDSALLIKTADCLPVVFIGEDSVAFVHAGWRGLAGNILTQAQIKNIRPYYAFIGPCIHKESFEVSEDFAQNFPKKNYMIKSEGRFYFDLVLFAISQILEHYPGVKVEDSEVCTYRDLSMNSYRRDKTEKRNWNVFSLTSMR